MIKVNRFGKSRVSRLGIALFLASSALRGQCYDLRSAELHEPVGHFREHWDHPIWKANPGEGNFQVDEPNWGGALEFAIFSIGTVTKTSAGWLPYQAHRRPEVWCDPAPLRSGPLCYMLPYQPVPATAVYRISHPIDREEWSVSPSGIVEYRHETKGRTKVIGARSTVPSDDLLMGSSFAVTTINLETLEYSFHNEEYNEGAYTRRIPGGVKLWRDVTLHAKLALREVACPTLVKKVALTMRYSLRDQEMRGLPVCGVKMNGSSADLTAKPASWEFLTNPRSVSAPEGCIKLFERELPATKSLKLPGKVPRREIHPGGTNLQVCKSKVSK